MKIVTFSYVWGNPGFNINEADFDFCFIQRFPETELNNIKFEKKYIRNYGNENFALGSCIISKSMPLNVESGEFSYFVEGAEEGQARYWQRLSINGIKIINGLISFPNEKPNYGNPVPSHVYEMQGAEVLKMVDDKTVLISDFHREDKELGKELNLNNKNLYNHLHNIDAFTRTSGLGISIDKIITHKDSNIDISNIKVIKYDREKAFGHWPIFFNIN